MIIKYLPNYDYFLAYDPDLKKKLNFKTKSIYSTIKIVQTEQKKLLIFYFARKKEISNKKNKNKNEICMLDEIKQLTVDEIVTKLEFFLTVSELTEHDVMQIHFLFQQWLILKELYTSIIDIPPELKQVRSCKQDILFEFAQYCQSQKNLPRLAQIDFNAVHVIDADENISWRVILLKVCTQDTMLSVAFPKTMQSIQHLDCCLAMFSILEPYKVIPVHTGYNCMLLRYHLGLIIPENCSITIDKQTFTWNPDIYFDDTFEHSVINGSNQFRVVLFLDIIRDVGDKDMNILIRKLVHKCKNSTFIQETKQRANKFHKDNEIQKSTTEN